MPDLPVVDPPDEDVEPEEREATVAGVLLAAGTSSRFGDENKLLAEVEGEPIVRRAARALLDSRADPVVVVVGYEAGRVRSALSGLPVSFVENPDYAAGQATSVRAGVRALREAEEADQVEGGDGIDEVDAVLFALGDMPAVSPATIDALIDAFGAGAGDALAAAFEGERGNPVLFDARFLDALADVDGDTGAREILLGSETAALVETGDPGVRADVDTEVDLDRLRDRST